MSKGGTRMKDDGWNWLRKQELFALKLKNRRERKYKKRFEKARFKSKGSFEINKDNNQNPVIKEGLF